MVNENQLDDAASRELDATCGRNDVLAAAFKKYRKQLRNHISHLVRDKNDQDDVLAETFAKATAKWDTFDPEKAGLRTWLAAIALNTARDLNRQRKRSKEVTGTRAEMAVPEPTVDEYRGLSPREMIARLVGPLSPSCLEYALACQRGGATTRRVRSWAFRRRPGDRSGPRFAPGRS